MENKPTNQSAQIQIQEAKPIGYLFNGRFYKSLGELRGKTMSEGNQPIALYTSTASSGERGDGEVIKVLEEYNKLLSDELDDMAGIASAHGWQSKRFEQGRALREKIATLKALPNPSTKQSVNPPAQEVDVEKEFYEIISSQRGSLPVQWKLASEKCFKVHNQALQSKAGRYSFSDVIDLLGECKLQLQYLSGKFKETGTTNAVISKINSKLQSLASTPLQTNPENAVMGRNSSLIKQESTSTPSEHTEIKGFELSLCDKCVQMTNHLNGVCQKCKPKEGEGREVALRFVEWASLLELRHGKWHDHNGVFAESTKELFQLFLTTNPSNKGA